MNKKISCVLVFFALMLMHPPCTSFAQSIAGKVVLVSPANTATNVSTSPLLVWMKADLAVTYWVEIAVDSFFIKIVDQTKTSSLGYTPVTLLQSHNYYWRVKGIPLDSAAAGPWSDTWSFTTSSPTLTAPRPILPADLSHDLDTALWFDWSRVANATGYHFQISLDNNFISHIRDTSVADTAVYITGLYLNTSYFWRVQATGDGGASSAFYETRFFTTSATSGVREPDLISSIVILADPFGVSLPVSVRCASACEVTVILYDLLGNEILRTNEGIVYGERTTRFDTNNLPQGTYILEVRAGDMTTRMKVIHIR
ncbi:MAG TPA: T9SS type A sorting domain-containing protein [Candidatus Kapabacteria bacterium]|nr:T9SS type A sorting domain-containing protein [Candidatus Kapabacteria bacterium]